jgi:hypothetical protein
MTDELDRTAAEAGEDMTWEKVREHLRAAVVYGLDHYGGHARGGAVADREAWRQASPEQLAEAITTFAMAGIGPVLTGEQVDSGLRLIRAVLAKAGIDPAGLDWWDVQP